MRKFKLYKKIRKVAVPPGTLDASYRQQKAQITVIDYDEKSFQEKLIKSAEEAYQFRDSPTVSWINVDGIDIDIIKKIDEHFRIHPLVLEDIINLGQRPKLEDYGDYLFLVVKMIYFDKSMNNDVIAEQVAIIIGHNFVISFQEKEGGDVFDPIRERLREDKGRVRKMKADYLAYTLLDTIIDNYFVILEHIGNQIDVLEDDVLKENPSKNILHEIHRLKTQLIFLRKQIWPLREVISSFQRKESKLIHKDTALYIGDIYDHTIQVNDTLEAFRDALSGIHDVYLSNLSSRTNEIMKVLTVFTAIFIPLTFIAGVYGMNFEYMPELKWQYGYYEALGFMAFVSLCMLIYFKKKNWF